MILANEMSNFNPSASVAEALLPAAP
jgi:hypothetical protein